MAVAKLYLPGTEIDYHGRRARIEAVGWVGERYYWLAFFDNSIAMLPASEVEACVISPPNAPAAGGRS